MNNETIQFKRFLEDVRVINILIDSAESLSASINSLRTSYAEEAQNEASQRKESQSLIKEFLSIFCKAREKILHLKMSYPPEKDSTEYLYATHRKGIAERMHKILIRFQSHEASILQNERARAKEYYQIAKPEANQEELKQLDDPEKAESLLKAAYALGNKENQKQLNDASEKYRNIQEISQTLNILNKTSETIQDIILEANDSIYRLSYEMHKTSHSSTSANQHLEQGILQKKRRRKLKNILIAIISILLILLALYILKPFR
ncbi:hypothetical protein NEFER03_1718 [Nematocida sp. LUAm3]|nr:hypothetical protein NEFER03_1718 [Nematocida sp. LUAm3]KAI5175708.1 hypothetical protein NEFER02_1595 [Nematocida sp. LUAm2]KAI5178614.1 hypothetical protein NEFER01_1750 [Nematocida sp. LUAm1]